MRNEKVTWNSILAQHKQQKAAKKLYNIEDDTRVNLQF